MDNQKTDDQGDMADILNPYNAFDNGPTLLDRFYLNMEASNRTGTVQGAVQDHGRPANRALFDARYEALPGWQGPMEGTAALLGAIAGGIWDKENSIPVLENFIPIGVGAKAARGLGMTMSQLRAKVFAGATDAAIVNAVTDAAIQGIEMDAGFRDDFSVPQWAASVGIGTVAGGVMGPLSHGPTKKDRALDELLEVPDTHPDFVDRSVRSAPTDSPDMPLSLPDGQKLDFGGASPLTEAKKALLDSQGSSEPVAFGDKYLPAPKRPDAPEVQQMATDETPLWTNNGKWSATDPDIVEVGQFGPVIDIEAHGKDWGKVVARLQHIEAGEAPRALDHPEIGDIDVVWGSYDPATGKGIGFKKIVEKHPEVIDNLPEIVRGSKIEGEPKKRVILVNDNKRTVIALDYLGQEKTWLLTSYEDLKYKGDKSQRDGKSILRSTSHQSDASSGSLADTSVNPKGGDIKESRRVEGRTERPDNHQADTSSASSADQDLRLEAPEGKPDAKASKADPELDAVIEKMESEELPFLTRTRGNMRGDLNRPEGGIKPDEAIAAHERSFGRIVEVSDKLAKITGVVGVRQKILKWPGKKTKGVWGTFNRRTGIIRMKVRDDFKVFAHEVGHHLDETLGEEFSNLIRLHAVELEPLHYPGTPEGQELSEGFAEFFRLYMTNPNYASQQAPRFNKEMTRYLKKNHADMLEGLVEVQDAFREWFQLPSDELLKSTNVSMKKKTLAGQLLAEVKEYGLGHTIADYLHDIYFHILDAKHPIKRAEDELARIFSEHTGRSLDLKAIDSPYKLARMAEGARSGAHVDILYGVHAYRSLLPGSASLRDAIIKAVGGSNVFSRWDDGRMADFAAYLKARRLIGEWDRFDQGLIPNEPDKVSRGDCITAIDHYEKMFPEFVEAAEMVYDWNLAFWKLKRDAGLISVEQYKAGLKIRDYVPMRRVLDDAGKSDGPKNSIDLASNQVDRFMGSMRDTVNPLESMIADAYETRIAIAQNDMVRALDRLAETAGSGHGAIVERIPAKEMRKIADIDAVDTFVEAAKKSGYGALEIETLRDMLEGTLIGGQNVSLFRPELTSEAGRGNVLFFRDGGTLKGIRIADGKFGNQMVKAFRHMNGFEQNFMVSFLAEPAKWLRVGVTSDPSFIIANMVRDQVIATIMFGKPFQRIKATGSGVVDELRGRDAARMYNQMGGVMGGHNAAAVHDSAVRHDMDALRKKGYLVQKLGTKNPIKFAKGLLELTEISETSTRIGLFKTFVEEAKARGMDDFEASFEAAWLARDYLDFNRRGYSMVALSRIIPFLNASLQGFDKGVRHLDFITPYVKKLAGQTLTEEEIRALPQAGKSWARLGALTIAGMGLHALMSETVDDYHKLSKTTRATHWAVKTGNKWVFIPKPFEMALFINIGEAVYDAYMHEDPTAKDRYLDGLVHVLLPPDFSNNPAIRTVLEQFSNKDTFSRRDIIPNELQGLEPYLQYSAATSEFSKMLSENLKDVVGLSPIMIDKYIVNFLGGQGRNLLALSDLAGNKPGLSIDDWPILRRFIKDASKGSRSSHEFWELVSPTTGEFEGAARSYKALRDAGKPGEAADYLASMSEEKRVYLISRHMEGKASRTKKLHPLDRARRASRAIAKLQKDLIDDTLEGSEGDVSGIPANDRGAARDILSSIAMEEASNALVLTNQPGWEHWPLIDISGHYRELEALNPKILKVLADRYATGNVVPFETVREIWPDYRKRLLEDGSDAPMADFEAIAKYERELGGNKIKRKAKPVVPGQGG